RRSVYYYSYRYRHDHISYHKFSNNKSSIGQPGKEFENRMMKINLSTVKSMIFFFVFIMMLVSTNGNAQTNFWDSKDAYLAQTPPGDTPITFDGKEWSNPKVIVEDLATPTLSIDGSKLFFGGQPVVIAMLIVIPASVWLAHAFLSGITYHTELTWWMFALAAVLTIVIALITASFQGIKAAVTNPVKNLRNE